MERTVVDVRTGKVSVVPLTPEEIAEIQSRPAPEPPPVLTPAEKLKAIGLTVEELKALLST